MLRKAGAKVGRQMMTQDPAALLRLDPAQDFSSAARLVALHRATAAEELAAFALLLRSDGPIGPSLGVLARSCIETLSRAWWILDARTSEQAERRARSMIVKELQAGERRGIQMLGFGTINEAIMNATLERDRVLDAPVEDPPSYTSLTRTALQDAGCPPELASMIYSHLSGVAHGESVFTESFIDPTSDGPDTLLLPNDNLGSYSGWIFTLTRTCTVATMKAWGLPDVDIEGYLQAAAEAAAAESVGD